MGLFSKKAKETPVRSLKAFVSGKVIPVAEVADPVFASKMLGDGVAVWPDSQTVTAPCDGVISMIAEGSFHAFGMTAANGAELLLHIGLDTVTMNGEGFRMYVKEKEKVRQGDRLMAFNRRLIEEKGLSAVCILLITNPDDFPDARFLSGMEAVQNETDICVF